MDISRTGGGKEPLAGLFFAILALALIFLAWSNRFIQDDAFISFRYARHWAEGKGLVWNEGEAVEGYTNFLWTVLMGVAHRLGMNPVNASYTLGLALFAGSLWFIWKLGTFLLDGAWKGLVPVFLAGTHYTFSAYATSGMETQLQTFLFLSLFLFAEKTFRSKRLRIPWLLGASLSSALAVLTRLDSVLCCVWVGFALGVWVLGTNQPRGRTILCLISLGLPFLVIVAGWSAWKLSMYGELLPNTFYAKVMGQRMVCFSRGMYYIYLYFLSYWLIPFPFLGVAMAGHLFRKGFPLIWLFGIVILSWFLYILYVGGDFMEFRFMVPVFPFLSLLVSWLILNMRAGKFGKAAWILLVVMGSLHHRMTFGVSTRNLGIDTTARLMDQLYGPDQDLVGVGKFLGKELKTVKDMTLAVAAAGAIPYYSRLESVDMLGLNDRWVARHGVAFRRRPGHQRIATKEYLVDRQVEWVVRHPRIHDGRPGEVRYNAKDISRLFVPIQGGSDLPPDARVVEMPLDPKRTLTVLYLVRSEALDELIREKGWHMTRILP